MSDPKVVKCSWLDDRELAGRGRVLLLDDGVRYLGIMRDSVLNSTNDFQVFGEAFGSVFTNGTTITVDGNVA